MHSYIRPEPSERLDRPIGVVVVEDERGCRTAAEAAVAARCVA